MCSIRGTQGTGRRLIKVEMTQGHLGCVQGFNGIMTMSFNDRQAPNPKKVETLFYARPCAHSPDLFSRPES